MKGLILGQTASVSRTFTRADVDAYRHLAGDRWLRFAAPPGPGAPPVPGSGPSAVPGEGPLAVPGPLLGGLFSQLLGTVLPGRGTNWLKQSLSFPEPAHTGQELTATVEIIRLRPAKQLVNLRTTCVNPAGALVCLGEALVLVRDRQEVSM